jgi:ABC-type Mn2+/Zn2+ transport system permease subunit
MLVSPEVARTSGVNVRRLNLLYLIAFAMTIALGLRYLGVLLMAALIITPAAAARRLARDLSGMLAVAVAIAIASTIVGSWIASQVDQETGPVIVTVAAAVFLVSLLYRRP